MAQIRIAAVPGAKLPLEHARARFVDGTESNPNVVTDSVYYRRAIARGDVVLVAADSAAAKGEG